jgi:hypothetical protein
MAERNAGYDLRVDTQQLKFAEKMAAELRRAGADGPLEIDEEQFRIVRGSQIFNLHNAYAEWQTAPRLRRNAVLRFFAKSLLEPSEPPDSVDEARPNLLPRIRELEWYEVLKLQFADARDGRGPAVVYERLNEELALEIVYDFPTAVMSVAPERLEAWGLSLDEAVRTARANLRERTPGSFEQLEPGVFGSPWQDTYDSSRLVLVELVTRLDVSGDPVALLPHRDHLFLTGSDDERGLGRIAALAAPLLEDHRRVTGRACVWRDGRWQPFVPPEGHPCRPRFVELRLQTDAGNYDEQKAVLEEQAEARGDDVFVASVLLVTDEATGESASLCTWTEGVRSLLPRTDQIAFVSPGATEEETQIMRVPWDHAASVMRDAMEPRGIVPERWYVDRFPTTGEREQLRRAELRAV